MNKISIRKLFRKCTSLMLAFTMCLSMVQFPVYAEEIGGEEIVVEETTEAATETVSEEETVTVEETTTGEELQAVDEETSEADTTEEVTTEAVTETEETTEEDPMLREHVNAGKPGKDYIKERIDDYAGDELNLCGLEFPERYIPELSQVPHAANQGFLGTCYAFATIGAVEANMIKRGASQADIDYSELALAYFTTNTVVDPLGGGAGDSNSYNQSELEYKRDVGNLDDVEAGNPCFTAGVLASWTGASDEALAPYDEGSSAVSKKVYIDDSVAFNDLAHVQGWYSVSLRGDNPDPIGLKKMITQCGGASLSYNAAGNIRQADGSIKTGYLGSDGISYFNHVDKDLNHFVTVVGWDDNYPAEKFDYDDVRPQDNGAWLVRNSWDSTPYEGETIEDNLDMGQFFWISYYDTSITDAYGFEVEDADNYDHNYQYDLVADWDSTVSENELKAANVFTAKACESGELLKAVSFQTNGTTNMDYTVKIYLNPEADNPESGQLVDEATTTGTTSFCGYYTVSLENPVTLKKGDKYAVVVEVSKEDDTVGLALEYSTTVRFPDYWYSTKIGITEGCSYYYDSEDGWLDVIGWYNESEGAYGNYKIKAFTDDIITAVPAEPVGESLLKIEAEYKGDETDLDEEYELTASDFEIVRIVEKNYEDSSLNYSFRETVDSQEEASNINVTYEDVIVADVINRKVTISYTYNGETCDCDLVLKINKAEEKGQLVIKYNDNAYAYTYTGAAIKPSVSVYYNGDLLKEKTDYTVAYKNNVNAYEITEGEDDFDIKKAPSIIITGKGNYKSVVTSYFVINPKNVGDDDIIAADIALKPSAKAVKPMPAVKYGKKALVKNNAGAFAPAKGEPTYLKDMTITYHTEDDTEYLNPLTDIPANATGTYIIHLEGTNNYTGDRDISVNICGIMMSGAKVTFYTDSTKETVNKSASYPYTGDEGFDIGELLSVTVTYKEGNKNLSRILEADEYSIDVDDNVEIGTKTVTITGNPNKGIAGVKTATFKIAGANIATVAKLIPLTGDYYYDNGNCVEAVPTVVLKADNSRELEIGDDYRVEYKNNINAGKATYTIYGTGQYTGKLTGTYTIKPIPAESLKLTVLNPAAPYVSGGVKAKVVVRHGLKVLSEGTDYTVSCKNNTKVTSNLNKPATYTVTMKGNYSGKLTGSYRVIAANIKSHTNVFATDVLRGSKVNKSVITITDSNGYKLRAGTDYDSKDLRYYYTVNDAGFSAYIDEYGELVVNEEARELKATDVIPSVDENGESIDVIFVVISGKNNYVGKVLTKFRVVDKNISVALAKTIAQPYTGKEVKPGSAVFEKIYVKDAKTRVETPLEEGVDYEILGYTNNIKRGTAKITIRGIGEYGGTKTFNFTIGQSSLITKLISLFK